MPAITGISRPKEIITPSPETAENKALEDVTTKLQEPSKPIAPSPEEVEMQTPATSTQPDTSFKKPPEPTSKEPAESTKASPVEENPANAGAWSDLLIKLE